MSVSVFISVDMEGIAGITTLRQTMRGTDDYAWAREVMTEEANAAIAGAFDASARRVVVSDSHADMGNLLPHKLDQRADLVQGSPKLPYSMMTGIEEGFACAAFIGYHAGAGTADAIMAHTYTGFITDLRVNGESWNETHLNAALSGTFAVPVGFRTPTTVHFSSCASPVSPPCCATKVEPVFNPVADAARDPTTASNFCSP